MTLTIDLPPDVERALNEKAQRTGQSVAEFAAAFLAQVACLGREGGSIDLQADTVCAWRRWSGSAVMTPAPVPDCRPCPTKPVPGKAFMKGAACEFCGCGKQAYDARLVAVVKVHGIGRILTFNVGDFNRYAAGERITVVDPVGVAVPPP